MVFDSLIFTAENAEGAEKSNSLSFSAFSAFSAVKSIYFRMRVSAACSKYNLIMRA